jgi:DNA-binding NarL/FixJ family response regulator
MLRVLLMDDERMFGDAVASGIALSGDFWVLGRLATSDPGWPDAVTSLRPDVVVLYSTGRAPEVSLLIRRITTAGLDAAIVLLRPALNAATAVTAARAGAVAVLDTDVTMDHFMRVLEAVRNGHACYPDLRVLRADAERTPLDEDTLGACEPNTTGKCYPVRIVDDHILFSTSLAIALRSEGFDAQTLAIASLKDFLDRPTTSAGLIVLDVRIGEDANGQHIDVADLTEDIQARGWRVLIVSGSDDSPRIAAAIAAGAIGYVPKSQSFDVLRDTIIHAAEGTPVMTNAERRTWLEGHRKHLAQERALTRRFTRLSRRECEVLQLLSQGMRAAAIAEHFVVSIPTVRAQIRSILAKLEVSCQLEAAALLRQKPAIARRFMLNERVKL